MAVVVQANDKQYILHGLVVLSATLPHPFNGLFSMTIWVSQYQKGKTSVDLNEASGISWTICKQSAPHSRQITTPTPRHSTFYRPNALPDAQPTVSKHWRLLSARVSKNYNTRHTSSSASWARHRNDSSTPTIVILCSRLSVAETQYTQGGNVTSSAPHQRITQPTSWPHVASTTWSSTQQVARPATKRFHASDWRPLEACCQLWTWWCNDATALAGYAVMMMMTNVTSAGWQVTLHDCTWHVSSRGAEASCKQLYAVDFSIPYLHTVTV